MTKHKTQLELPEIGFVFWPVGTGDSTTIVADDETIVQVDLHHMSASDDDDDKHVSIVDELERVLPKRDGDPYLAVFVLTHPDQDHCLGFADLLERIHIGELWFSPRILREYTADLCDDGKAFRKEAKRRVKETIEAGGDVDSGDRVRIIGYDDLLKDEEQEGFPEERLTVPGTDITELDGEDRADVFRAFVHAPFKEDTTGDRNDNSVALQVTLTDGEAAGKLLLLGDLCYPTIRNIFTRSDDEDLEWNVMLAAHHCSKSVMYWKEEGEEDEKLKQDILDDMEKAGLEPGYIVSSSEPVPSSNKSGDNPPHAKAKKRYEEIVPDEFQCTQEFPSEDDPKPIVFELTGDGLSLVDSEERSKAGASLAASVAAARGRAEPPQERVGFGFGS